MQILFIGDVVGKSGCRYLERTLPELRRQYGADVTIVNGENSAPGNGITAASAEQTVHRARDHTRNAVFVLVFHRTTPAK